MASRVSWTSSSSTPTAIAKGLPPTVRTTSSRSTVSRRQRIHHELVVEVDGNGAATDPSQCVRIYQVEQRGSGFLLAKRGDNAPLVRVAMPAPSRRAVDRPPRCEFPFGMDATEIAIAYRRRADEREARREERYAALRRQAFRLGGALREAFGSRTRVYLFGSLLDIDRYRDASDIDLAVEGLDPAEYWEALRIVDEISEGASVDLVRLETAAEGLRTVVRHEGEVLP